MRRREVSLLVVLIFILSICSIAQTSYALGENGATVAAGHGTTFYITQDGTLWGFGDNELGQVGVGSEKNYLIKPVKILDNVASVSSGSRSTFAVKRDGSLWYWGWAVYIGKSLSPQKLLDDVSFVATNAGDESVFVIKKDATLWIRGNSTDLKLDSIFTNSVKTDFQQVPNSSNVKFAVASGANKFYITNEDELWGWGRNSYGTLGIGHESDVGLPVKIMDNVSSVACDNANTMIITKDRDLFMCGKGNNGKFYNGSTVIEANSKTGFITTPVKVMENVIHAASRGNDFYAVKQDKTLWGWGDNRMKIINPESSSDINTPVEICSEVNYVVCGERHMVLEKIDNTVWTGGENYRGGISGEPVGKTTSYPLRQTAYGVISSYYKPVYMGNVVTGGDRIELSVDFPNYYGKDVDIWIAIALPDGSFYVINELEGVVFIEHQGFIPFAKGLSGAGKKVQILPSFSVDMFGTALNGKWSVYWLVAPSSNGDIIAAITKGYYEFGYYYFNVAN